MLFGAELRAASGGIVKLGGLDFAKLRTRRIAELLAYTDDKLGLGQLQNAVRAA